MEKLQSYLCPTSWLPVQEKTEVKYASLSNGYRVIRRKTEARDTRHEVR